MWVQVHLHAPPPNLVVPIEWKEKTPPISSGPNCSWKGHLNPSYRLIFHGIRPRKSWWSRDFPVGFPPDRIHNQLLQKGEPQSVSQLYESSDGQNWKFTKSQNDCPWEYLSPYFGLLKISDLQNDSQLRLLKLVECVIKSARISTCCQSFPEIVWLQIGRVLCAAGCPLLRLWE